MCDPYIGKEVSQSKGKVKVYSFSEKGIANWMSNGTSVWSKWSIASSLDFGSI